MSQQKPANTSESEKLHKQVTLRPERAPVSGILFGLSLAVLGGFLGGVITNYGPSYLYVHLTQVMLEPAPTTESSQPAIEAKVSETTEAETTESEEIAVTATAPSLPSGANARLVVQSGHRTFVLLQTEANPTWAKAGASIKRTSDGEHAVLHTYTQKVRPSALSSELQLWNSRELSLYDAKGYRCSAKVGHFVLLQQVAEDSPNDNSDNWNDSTSLVLAAQLNVNKGRCTKAVWARDASLPAPAIARRTKASRALRKIARKTFRASAAHKKLQQEYNKEGHTGYWDQFDFDSIQIDLVTGSSETLLRISAAAGGCGDFMGRLDQLYLVSENKTLTQVPSERMMVDSILAAADFDGDGDLDFISNGEGWDYSIVEQKNGEQNTEFVETMRNPVLVYMCRC